MIIGLHKTEGFLHSKGSSHHSGERAIGWEHPLSVHHRGSGKNKLNTTKKSTDHPDKILANEHNRHQKKTYK